MLHGCQRLVENNQKPSRAESSRVKQGWDIHSFGEQSITKHPNRHTFVAVLLRTIEIYVDFPYIFEQPGGDVFREFDGHDGIVYN